MSASRADSRLPRAALKRAARVLAYEEEHEGEVVEWDADLSNACGSRRGRDGLTAVYEELASKAGDEVEANEAAGAPLFFRRTPDRHAGSQSHRQHRRVVRSRDEAPSIDHAGSGSALGHDMSLCDPPEDDGRDDAKFVKDRDAVQGRRRFGRLRESFFCRHRRLPIRPGPFNRLKAKNNAHRDNGRPAACASETLFELVAGCKRRNHENGPGDAHGAYRPRRRR